MSKLLKTTVLRLSINLWQNIQKIPLKQNTNTFLDNGSFSPKKV